MLAGGRLTVGLSSLDGSVYSLYSVIVPISIKFHVSNCLIRIICLLLTQIWKAYFSRGKRKSWLTYICLRIATCTLHPLNVLRQILQVLQVSHVETKLLLHHLDLLLLHHLHLLLLTLSSLQTGLNIWIDVHWLLLLLLALPLLLLIRVRTWIHISIYYKTLSL